MSRRAERPLPVHLIYLAEACRIAPLLRREAAQHVHAHFGTNSAEVAMLVNASGRTWMEFYCPRTGGIRQRVFHRSCRKD